MHTPQFAREVENSFAGKSYIRQSYTQRCALALLCLTLAGSACDDDSQAKQAPEPGETPAALAKGEETKTTPPVPEAEPIQAPLATLDLEGLGYQIDAPSAWPLKKLGEGVFRFELTPISQPGKPMLMPSLILSKSPMGPDTSEALGKRCKGKLLDSGMKGALMFHNCQSEMSGVTIHTAEYVHKAGVSYVTCAASGLGLEIMNQVCSSLRQNGDRTPPPEAPASVDLGKAEPACLAEGEAALNKCLKAAKALVDGTDGQADPKLALAMFAKTCERESGLGCLGAMLILRGGSRASGDAVKSKDYAERACGFGMGSGCLMVGIFHDEGVGGTKDQEKAVDFYKKGCELSDWPSCANLGTMYSQGTGVPQDGALALKYLGAACDKDDPRGCGILGVVLAQGKVVAKDLEQARTKLAKACRLGFAPACEIGKTL